MLRRIRSFTREMLKRLRRVVCQVRRFAVEVVARRSHQRILFVRAGKRITDRGADCEGHRPERERVRLQR